MDYRRPTWYGLLVPVLLATTSSCRHASMPLSDGVALLSSDDAVGTDIGGILKNDLKGLSARDLVLLAVMGPRNTCSLGRFRPGNEAKGRYTLAIYVYESQGHDVPASSRNDVRIVSDGKGRIASELGVGMPPRFFELDGRGVVLRADTGDPVRDGMLEDPTD